MPDELHKIERRTSYTDIPHKDPNLRIIGVSEVVFDNGMDTLLQARDAHHRAATVTAEFMRDVDDSLNVVADIVEGRR